MRSSISTAVTVRALGELCREDTRSGPDLEHVVVLAQLGGVDDGTQHPAVDEEALAERRRGADSVPPQQRLEGVRIGDVHRGKPIRLFADP